MTAARQLSRAEILALPPACTLADLAGCLGLSEPVVRDLNRGGELAALGIKVSKLGAQHRVITSSVWDYLGISPDACASTESAGRNGAGQRRPAAPALRAVDGRVAKGP